MFICNNLHVKPFVKSAIGLSKLFIFKLKFEILFNHSAANILKKESK